MRQQVVEAESGVLTPALFARFAGIAYEAAGIRLKVGKESLVLARVTRRLRALQMASIEAYADYLERDTTGTELVHFLDAISTNVTSFFREREHFDYIARWVSEAARSGRKRMRFWSAACSSGEEPYTLAMVLDDTLGKSVDWRILATDVSTQVLERAGRGLYSERTVEQVPGNYRSRYLQRTQVAGEAEPLWAVAPGLRQKIVFRRMNLAQPPYPMKGPLDIVMCRNVMIYFDDAIRLGIVKEAERMLVPGGAFITSHTETLAALHIELKAHIPSIYVKGGPE